MNVSKHLNWCVNSENHGLVLKDTHALVSQGQNVLASECEVSVSIIRSSPLPWTQEVTEEEVVESVLWRILLVLIISITASLLFFLQAVKWFGNNLAGARVDFKLSAVHSYLVVVSGKGLHGRCATSICATALTCCSVAEGLWLAICLGLSNAHLEFGLQMRQILEEIEQIDLNNRVCWDVRCLFFKTTVHEDLGVNGPNSVTESLKAVEFVPLT